MRVPKASTQPWPIPDSWRWAAMGEIATMKSGDVSHRKGGDFSENGVPWLKASELSDGFVFSTREAIAEPALISAGATIFPTGTVCIARCGSTVGRVGILQMPAVASSAICAVLPSEALWPEYLFRFLQFERPDLASRKSRATQPYITLSTLRSMSIPVAPIHQQRLVAAEISSRLAHLDSRSRQLNRGLAELKKYRSSMFGAVLKQRLALNGWLPQSQTNGKGHLDSIHAQLFGDGSRSNRESRPAALPEGWTLKSAQQVCSEVIYGWDVQPAYERTGQRLVTVKSVGDGPIDFASCGFISDALFERHKRHCSPRNDDILLVGGGPNLGRTALVDSDSPFAIGRNVLLLRPTLYSRYFFEWLRSRECQHWIQKAAGPARTHLRLSEIRRIPVLVPPPEQQVGIVAEVDRCLSMIDRLETAMHRLQERAASARNEVLERAFHGQLEGHLKGRNSNRHARPVGKLPLHSNRAGRSLSL